ncbi:MAG: hypothetical protein H0U91_09585 [Rubrobacter sp.]|nr:hypothetical protein [Rubrobacter sp.]
MRRAGRPDAVVLLSCAVAALMLLPLREVTEHVPIVPFAAGLALFLAPGVLLSGWFLAGHVRGAAIVPVAFALSTGLFGLTGVPFLIVHASIEAYLWIAGAMLAVFLAGALWRTLGGGGSPTEDNPPDGPSGGWLWAPFGLLAAVLAFVSTRRVPGSYDDVWVYLAWVRDFSVSEGLALRDPYFGEAVGGLSRVKVNGWLLEQAALSRVSGIDPIEMVLRYLTPALVVVALLAVYALARALFEDERAAVICGCVFALFHVVFIEASVHNIGVELAARISEDKHAARFLILPVALLFAVLFVKTRKRRHLVFFASLCWTMVAVHPVVLAPLGLCMLGFGVVRVAANPRRRDAWTGMILLALALWSVALGPALLVLAARTPTEVLFSADINATPPEVLEYTVFVTESWRHIYELGDGSYIMHPWLLLNPVILGACVLGVPFLMRRVRDNPAAQLLLGGLLAVSVTVYVPPVATFVGDEVVGPGLLWRLAWPIPLLALLTGGWMVWEALRYAEERLGGLRRGVGRVVPLLLVLLLTAAAAPASVTKVVDLYGRFEVARTAEYDPDPIYPWLQANLKEPSLLLARDSANNIVPAYSASLDVVSQRGEGMIRDRRVLEERANSEIEIPQRYLDVHDFFFGTPLDKRSYAILRRYKPDYLMVRADEPLDEKLRTLPAFSPVSGVPTEAYNLYTVGLDRLDARPEAPESQRQRSPKEPSVDPVPDPPPP